MPLRKDLKKKKPRRIKPSLVAKAATLWTSSTPIPEPSNSAKDGPRCRAMTPDGKMPTSPRPGEKMTIQKPKTPFSQVPAAIPANPPKIFSSTGKIFVLWLTRPVPFSVVPRVDVLSTKPVQTRLLRTALVMGQKSRRCGDFKRRVNALLRRRYQAQASRGSAEAGGGR